jgi:hypothetical protein
MDGREAGQAAMLRDGIDGWTCTPVIQGGRDERADDGDRHATASNPV